MTPHQDFAWRISDAVARDERNFLRSMGADWIEAYTESWKIADETYNAALMPARDVAFLGLRKIENRETHE